MREEQVVDRVGKPIKVIENLLFQVLHGIGEEKERLFEVLDLLDVEMLCELGKEFVKMRVSFFPAVLEKVNEKL